MVGIITICAGIFWLFIVIDVIFCILTGYWYKKLKWKGAAKRIILSLVILFLGLIFGGGISGLINFSNPLHTVYFSYGFAYIVALIAIFYIANVAIEAKKSINEINIKES